MNFVAISGRLGKKIEPVFTSSGKEKVSFTIAVYAGKDRESEWFDVEVWEYLAKKATKASVGDIITVSGRNRSVKYADKDGLIRYKKYIEASDITIERKEANNATNYSISVTDDNDMPF